MVNISDIMVSNRLETSNGLIYRVSFYDNITVDDFVERKLVLEAVVCENSDGGFVIVDDNGYDETEIYESICEANKTEYTVHYYDLQNKDLNKKDVVGLKSILKLNDCNNIIDVIKK